MTGLGYGQGMSTANIDTAREVARLLNEGVDEFTALESVGLDPDEDVMPEDACLPLGDVDCDVIDFCNGTLIRRPERRRNSDGAGRTWTIGTYERD